MEKNSKQSKLNELLTKQVDELVDQLSRLERKIENISASPVTTMSYNRPNLYKPITTTQPKIINFPVPKTNYPSIGKSGSSLFRAKPGNPLPAEVPDFRSQLQRDGLILLGWDWRLTEKGGVYTAYWVTSSGVARYYASKPLSLGDFYSALPDHKSYAAEDGIEFYGQTAPVYIVHVAPELMMSNPTHGTLRQAHIKALKRLGSKVDFNYKFLLKTEKSKKVQLKNHKAG